MINASPAFIEAMTSPITQVYLKMELLDRNDNVLDVFVHQVDKSSVGDITIDESRDIQRTFTFSMDNSDGKFTWGQDKTLWVDNKMVKLYIGLPVGDDVEYIPQGVFVITQPTSTSKPTSNIATINGQDKAYLLTGNMGRFSNILTVEKNTNIKEAIRILAVNGDISSMILDECDEVTPYDLTYQIGDNRWRAMQDLAEFVLYSVYFDVNGYLRFEPKKDPEKYAPCWSYKIDDTTLYAGSVRKLDDKEFFNHIKVSGGSGQTAVVTYDLVIDENVSGFENHPFSIQKVGRRFWPWNNGAPDSMIDHPVQCAHRARYEMIKRLRLTEQVELSLAPNYLHEVGDVIEIIDERNGCVGNYLLEKINIPIVPKIVTATTSKIYGELPFPSIYTNPATDEFTGNGSKKVFDLRYVPSPLENGKIEVYINDALQSSGYTIDAEGKKITFSSAPASGRKIEVTYRVLI